MPPMHKHRVKTESQPHCYNGPVAWPENPSAHGSLVVKQTCSCGATRSVNRNGGHKEVGLWKP